MNRICPLQCALSHDLRRWSAVEIAARHVPVHLDLCRSITSQRYWHLGRIGSGPHRPLPPPTKRFLLVGLVARPEPIPRAERFFASTRINFQHVGNGACYRLRTDEVLMPPLAAFADIEGYYTTFAHESIHWALRPSRLNANVGRQQHHAREEVMAEFGAAFLCADLPLFPKPPSNHASYISFCFKTLKCGDDALSAAAILAQRAVMFLHGLQPPPNVGGLITQSYANSISANAMKFLLSVKNIPISA